MVDGVGACAAAGGLVGGVARGWDDGFEDAGEAAFGFSCGLRLCAYVLLGSRIGWRGRFRLSLRVLRMLLWLLLPQGFLA